jgi:hypothetical protein
MKDKNFRHEPDCAYPQTELWSLCTCPPPPQPPKAISLHDPLCPNQPEYHDGSVLWPARCDCDLIAKVRKDEANRVMSLRYTEVTGWQDMKEALAWQQGQRDMLAHCIALIEESVPWSTENWIAVDERAAILAALRDLQDRTENGTDTPTRRNP